MGIFGNPRNRNENPTNKENLDAVSKVLGQYLLNLSQKNDKDWQDTFQSLYSVLRNPSDSPDILQKKTDAKIRWLRQKIAQNENNRKQQGKNNKKEWLALALDKYELKAPNTLPLVEYTRQVNTHLNTIVGSQDQPSGGIARGVVDLSLDGIAQLTQLVGDADPRIVMHSFWPEKSGQELPNGEISKFVDKIMLTEASSFFVTSTVDTWKQNQIDTYIREYLPLQQYRDELNTAIQTDLRHLSGQEIDLAVASEKKQIDTDAELALYVQQLLRTAAHTSTNRADLKLNAESIGITLIKDDVPFFVTFPVQYESNGQARVPEFASIFNTIHACMKDDQWAITKGQRQALRDVSYDPNRQNQLKDKNTKALVGKSQFVVSINTSDTPTPKGSIHTYGGGNVRAHAHLDKASGSVITKFAHRWFNGMPATEFYRDLSNGVFWRSSDLQQPFYDDEFTPDAESCMHANIQLKDGKTEKFLVEREFFAEYTFSPQEAERYYSTWSAIKEKIDALNKKLPSEQRVSFSPSDLFYIAYLFLGKRTAHNIFGDIDGDGKKLDTALMGLPDSLLRYSAKNISLLSNNRSINIPKNQEELLNDFFASIQKYNREKNRAKNGQSSSAFLHTLTKPIQGITTAVASILDPEKVALLKEEVDGMTSCFVRGATPTSTVELQAFFSAANFPQEKINDFTEFVIAQRDLLNAAEDPDDSNLNFKIVSEVKNFAKQNGINGDILENLVFQGMSDLHVTTAQSESYYFKKKSRENVIKNQQNGFGGPMSLSMAAEKVKVGEKSFETPMISVREFAHQISVGAFTDELYKLFSKKPEISIFRNQWTPFLTEYLTLLADIDDPDTYDQRIKNLLTTRTQGYEPDKLQAVLEMAMQNCAKKELQSIQYAVQAIELLFSGDVGKDFIATPVIEGVEPDDLGKKQRKAN